MTITESYPQLSSNSDETAGQREKGLENLRVKIQSLKKDSLSKFREDDSFLLCFLRSRKFDVDRAFKCYQRYYKLRSSHPTIMYPSGVGPLDRVKFFELNNVTLQRKRNPIDGSTIYIWRKGDWLPGADWDLAEHLTPSYWMIEHALKDPAVQQHGVQIVIDGNGITWSMLPYIKVMVFKVLVHTIQDAFPARFRAIHIVNQPGLYDYIYACIRPFLKPKIVKRIHLHGTNMESLYKHIDPEVLPDEYGGKAGPFTNHWIREQLYARDEEFRRYSYYGFEGVGG